MKSRNIERLVTYVLMIPFGGLMGMIYMVSNLLWKDFLFTYTINR
jgi:hypothetical protein